MLAKNAQEPDRGGLTLAGRAYQKHMNRAGSAFPRVTGNAASINQHAQAIVEQFLADPGKRIVVRPHGRFGTVIDIFASDGRGLRYDQTKRFITFLEPK